MQDDTSWWREIDLCATALFLDVDGTLLGFKERPEDVVADPALLDLLRGLHEATGGALALVSGRMISDLDRIVDPLVLPAAGVHGAELRFADGRRAAAAGAAIAEVRAAVAAFVEARPGLRLEDKGGAALALHYRQAPERADEARAFLAETVRDDALAIQHGKMVAEVKAAGCHKGMAIAALLGMPPFTGRTPLFAGDDLTDEYGFEMVNGVPGGVSIKIGGAEDTGSAQATSARRRLPDTSAVRDFLASLLNYTKE